MSNARAGLSAEQTRSRSLKTPGPYVSISARKSLGNPSVRPSPSRRVADGIGEAGGGTSARISSSDDRGSGSTAIPVATIPLRRVAIPSVRPPSASWVADELAAAMLADSVLNDHGE